MMLEMLTREDGPILALEPMCRIMGRANDGVNLDSNLRLGKTGYGSGGGRAEADSGVLNGHLGCDD